MVSYKIHLIRTGSTSANPWKRYVGQSDLPLCDEGRRSLERLHQEFTYPPCDRVYASPLSRCVQTAEVLYPDRQLVSVDGLMDMNLGSFEGKSFEELREEEAFSRWLADSFKNTPPGGEPTDVFTQRVLGALDSVLRDMMEQKITSAAVVTHGGVVMALMAAVALPRLPLHQWAANNGCGYTLMTSAQMWMRDKCAELYAFIPDQSVEDDRAAFERDMYYNEEILP